MPETESVAQLVGRLVLEQISVDRSIGALRDELGRRAATYARIGRLLLFQPEKLFFDEQNEEQFAGEAAIDRASMDVDALVADLRAAIVHQKAIRDWLAQLGCDREAMEQEENLRRSRALRSQSEYGGDAGDARTGTPAVGFTRPKKARC